MPRDWPDPRIPDQPLSAFEVGLTALAVFVAYTTTVWAIIDGVRRLVG